MRDVEELIELRRPRWQRLAALLDEAENTLEEGLGMARLNELLRLYREASSDLNQVRGLTRNPLLLEHVNQLVGRAYRFIYRGSGGRKLDLRAVRRFFSVEIPETFRREEKRVLLAALAMLLGIVVGAFATVHSRADAASFVPPSMFTEQPGERVRKIESSKERVDTLGKATAFGAYLYTHNIQVSFLAFALGAVTLLGGLWLAFYNGVLLGVVATTYVADGVGAFFVAWVGPHGALELPAILFATAAGLRAGEALLLPGERGRPAALREALPVIFRMMTATALLLVCAGIVEGSFSQLSAQSVPYPIKIAVAAALFSGMIAWLFLQRRRS